MIAHLRGTLLDKKPGQVTLEVGGVGYKVLIPLSTYYELDGEGTTVSFRIHTHVREDTLALFGFLTEIEEMLFQRLISVAGVGPSLALKVLSGLEPPDLVDAIRHGDLHKLGSIPGVGKKTAERLVVELKEKMPEMLAVGERASGSQASAPELALREDLLSALVNLGYQRAQADTAVLDALKNDANPTFEKALKEALRRLSS
ncbi:MAG TPA: Holliday junction branch migration protein RuvA [Vicinamibacteria bacterium]|jgi:Holliday junction DNA helicase RuvA